MKQRALLGSVVPTSTPDMFLGEVTLVIPHRYERLVSRPDLFVSQSVMDFLKAAVVASSPFSSVLTPATWARYKHICCNGQDGLLVPVASSLCSASLSVLHCSLALDVRSIHTLLCLTFDLLFG